MKTINRMSAQERILTSRTAENARIFTKRSEQGFTVWIQYSGQSYFMATQRFDPLLYALLKDGLSLREIRAFAPRHGHRYTASGRFYGDRTIHAMQHLTRVAEDFILYDLCEMADGEIA